MYLSFAVFPARNVQEAELVRLLSKELTAATYYVLFIQSKRLSITGVKASVETLNCGILTSTKTDTKRSLAVYKITILLT